MAETNVGTETEAAWKQAGDERRETPAPTGDAVATVDGEKQRIQRMIDQGTQEMVDERRMFRAPGAGDQPAERPERAPEQRPQPEFKPEEEVETPSAKASEAQDEGAALERQLLGNDNGHLPELPDTIVKVGGTEIPLSRIRTGLEAAAQRDQWQAALTQKEQAIARSNDLMIEAAREFKRDPLNALEKIGVDKQELLRDMRARGLVADGEPSPSSNVPDLGEDADPIAKALLKENRALKAQIEAQGGKIDRVERQMKLESDQRQAAAVRQQQAAALSGVKSDLTSIASKMPSMTETPGKLNPTGKLLVDFVDQRLRQELAAYGGSVDPAHLKNRAIELFKAQARDAGVTPKTVQARNALSRQKAPVPTRVGTTLPLGGPAEGGSTQTKPFNFGNDEQRRAAIAQWIEANAET